MSESNPRPPEIQAAFGAPPIIFGTMATCIRGPDGGPWEAVHPATGNGADPCPAYFCTDDFPAKPEPNGHVQQQKKTSFDYVDEAGVALFREVRLERLGAKKQTWQEASDPDRPGQWITGHGCMDGVRRVPFWLPGLIEALKSGETIFIVEGPRKCGPLHEWGLAATCNMGGSGAASIWREHAKEFFLPVYSSPVVTLPDNDAPGAKSAAIIADALASVGVAVSILGLPGLGPKGDIVNWRDAGGTREQFLDLVETEARPWTPSEREPLNVGRRLALAAPEIITRRASDITPEPISWLWKYWLARGKLHIIGGVPETGKTTIALAYVAIISSGGTWPDGTRAAVGNCLIWTSEDDPADTLVPRLMRMGADLSRIHFIEEAIPPGAKSRPFNPATDMPALAAKAEAIGDVVLLILDPVVAAMPMIRNSHNNAETRNGMQPVVDFAKAAEIATIGIGHLTKGTAGKDPLERLNGSGAFGALPRLVMGAAKNEADAGEDKPERVMVRIKSNIGPSGGGFGYHIDMAALLENPAIEATRIVWELPLEGTARELLNAAEGLDEDDKTSKVAEAMMFLEAALAKGERPAREVLAEAKAAGIAEKTLRRAAERTVGKRKAALGWHWWWLP